MINDSPAMHAAKLLTWISTQINGNPELAAQCYRAGHELEAQERMRAALRAPNTCRRCGRPLERSEGRGRPRVYCLQHSPRKNPRKIITE